MQFERFHRRSRRARLPILPHDVIEALERRLLLRVPVTRIPEVALATPGYEQHLPKPTKGRQTGTIRFDASHVVELRPDLVGRTPPPDAPPGPPANIVWINRATTTTGGATDTDGFGAVFGANAPTARADIDAVIVAYERAIGSFNYSDNSANYNLTVSMGSAGNGASAGVSTTLGGKPKSGSISMGSGNDGHGGMWFLDPTPFDNSEFEGDITNAFSGDAQSGSPAANLGDFFTVACAELTHCMGQTTVSAFSNLTTNTGAGDVFSGVGSLWVFRGPSIKHLMTSFNAGATNDFHAAIHTAEGSNAISFGGDSYRGAEDQGNAVYEFGRRYLVDLVDSLMFKDAYAYSSINPAQFGTFYATRNSGGQLVVRGGSGASNDVIAISSDGSNVTVSVDVGNDVPGTGALPGAGNLPAWVSTFGVGSVTSISVDAGAGNDTILLDSVGPNTPVSINAGDGDDLIALANASGNLDNIQSPVTIDGGTGTDEPQFYDGSATFSDTYTITGTTFGRDAFPGATYANCELPDLFAETGSNSINMNSTAGGTDWFIAAGAGNDVLNWGSGNLDSMLGTASFDGQGGSDSVNVLDQGVNFSDDYTITSSTVARDFAATLTYLNAEDLTVACDTGNNTINVNSVGDPTSILANGGNDTLFIGAGNLGNIGALVNFNAGPGVDAAVVDDSTAAVATTYTITNASVTATAGPFPGFNYSTLEFLTLSCGQANDAINVNSTATGTNTAVNGNGGSDFISAGAGNLDNLAGHLTFTGGAGSDAISLSDASVTVGSAYVVTASDVTLTNAAAFAGFSYASSESLVLNTSSSDDGVTVNSTAAATPLTANTGNGNDTLNFGNTTLASMAASVTFNAGAGTDSANVNDQSDTTAGTFAISTGSVSRSGVAGLLSVSLVEGLNVNGDASGNTMNVNSAAAGIPLVVNSGNGSDVINVNATSIGSSVVVNAQDGNDILHIADPSDNLANVAGAVTFNGQNGVNDQITLSDISLATAIAYTLGATTVARSGFGGLTYGTSEVLTVSAGSGSDTFTVNAIGAPTVLNGNDGNDRLTVTAALGSTLTFNGGSGATNTSDGITISPTVTAATGDYTPSSVTPGNGFLNINAHTINFTGLEGSFPSVSVSNVTTFTFFTPSSQDAVDVDTGGVSGGTANIISGTSNGVAMQRLLFDHVTNFILNTGLNDGVGGGNPDDTVNIHLNGLTATGLSSFRYIGGTSAANNDVINIDSGPLTFSADAATDTSNLTINASHAFAASPPTVVTFNATQHLAGLNLSNDATASMPANGSRVLVAQALTATGTSKLDLFDNDVIVDYGAASPLAAIQSLINAARSGGTWLGNGLTSTAARTNGSHNTTLGAMEASDFKSIYGAAALFDGQSIDTTAVLVKYTYYGDADFNGKVNFDDYVRTDNGFNNHRTGWPNGDFDGNGSVNFDDYVLIDLAFNTQSGTL